MPRMKRPLPEVTDTTKDLPEEKELNKDIPDEKPLDKEQPTGSSLDKALPPDINYENVIRLGGEDIEIKPTKLLYQRNRTAAAYRILDVYPLPDILAMEKGILDPERDGDAIVMDFLIAVFDNKALVKKYYDSMTSEDVDKILKIFKRLNHIEDKEEAAKNRQAKGMNN